MPILPAFPEVVNDKAARTVAAVVAAVSVIIVITGWYVLTVVLALGFLARVLAGPRWSPLAILATRVVAPRLGAPVYVPGPPKRFAQAIGLAVTCTAAFASLVFGATGVAVGALGVLVVFATLEAAVGFCAGCWVFGHLMRWGLVPETVCLACSDLRLAPGRR